MDNKAIISELQTIRAYGTGLAEMAAGLIEKLEPAGPKKKKGLTDEQKVKIISRRRKLTLKGN